jgi:hypothetical protein
VIDTLQSDLLCAYTQGKGSRSQPISQWTMQERGRHPCKHCGGRWHEFVLLCYASPTGCW